MSEYYKEIGPNLKKIMTQRKMTAKDLATKAGITPTHISYLINNKRRPSFELLCALSDVLDVSVDRLTGEAASSIINDSLEKSVMTLPELAEKAKVTLRFLQNLDDIVPMDDDYDNMSRIAKVLNLRPGILHAALARQEPPVYDGPHEIIHPEDIFTVIEDEDTDGNPFPIRASTTRKVDNYNFDLTEEEYIAVQAFIETFRQIKQQASRNNPSRDSRES